MVDEDTADAEGNPRPTRDSWEPCQQTGCSLEKGHGGPHNANE